MKGSSKLLLSLLLALAPAALSVAQPAAVDMGLSVKWASCNLGADVPQGSGDFYAWGETAVKADYSGDTYYWSANPAKYAERFILNRQLDAEDDAAQARLGGGWRMPTFTEMNELVQQCDWQWTTLEGVNGYRVTSRTTGGSIFLPAAGYKEGQEVLFAGSAGRYWTATRHPYHANCAMELFFSSDFHYAYFYRRLRGYPIRPVCE